MALELLKLNYLGMDKLCGAPLIHLTLARVHLIAKLNWTEAEGFEGSALIFDLCFASSCSIFNTLPKKIFKFGNNFESYDDNILRGLASTI